MILWAFKQRHALPHQGKCHFSLSSENVYVCTSQRCAWATTESRVHCLIWNRKAICETKKAKGVPLMSYMSSNFCATKNRSLVICAHIAVTLVCSHLYNISHAHWNGFSACKQQLLSAFSLKQVLCFIALQTRELLCWAQYNQVLVSSVWDLQKCCNLAWLHQMFLMVKPQTSLE